MNKEKKIFFSVIIVVMVILSIFLGFIQIQINGVTSEENHKQAVEITIIADKSSGTSPLTVNFKSLILNNEGNLKYYWNFGDGASSNEKNPSYTYKEKGEYVCKLSIDYGSGKKEDSYNIIVFPNNPPEVKIVCDTTAFRPATINFDAGVFDPEGENLTYHWNIKYPTFFGIEKNDSSNEKSFSKKFWRNGNYVAELTVTDESGNSATDYEIIQVQKSQIEQLYDLFNFIVIVKSPAIMRMIWGVLEKQFSSYLDDNWLDFPESITNLILKLLKFGDINYEPPIPKASLVFSDIDTFNHSLSVNSSGGVPSNVSISNSIIIENDDTVNVAKNVFLTLEDPFTGDKGLPDEIAVKELTISIDVSGISKQIFYNAEYKSYEDCVLIDNLANGDMFTGRITVSLDSAIDGTFKDNKSYSCRMFIYQEKADFVESIPFELVT